MSLLKPSGTNLGATELSRTTLAEKKLIQHSHSPCVTPKYVVSKLDAFKGREPSDDRAGLLKFAYQGEADEWLVMDRRRNASKLLRSEGASFVNNHFWNCYESEGDVVVQAVPATSAYLDAYFEQHLDAAPAWSELFQAPLECRVPTDANATVVACAPLLAADAPIRFFDYPTFNPLFKMRATYEYFYAIAPADDSSQWFDTLVKVRVAPTTKAEVVSQWSAPGVYLTEADFAPTGGSEDDGVLIAVLYNSTSDVSSLAIFDAKDLSLLSASPLDYVVPFHAHGIVCPKGEACYSNP